MKVRFLRYDCHHIVITISFIIPSEYIRWVMMYLAVTYYVESEGILLEAALLSSSNIRSPYDLGNFLVQALNYFVILI